MEIHWTTLQYSVCFISLRRKLHLLRRCDICNNTIMLQKNVSSSFLSLVHFYVLCLNFFLNAGCWRVCAKQAWWEDYAAWFAWNILLKNHSSSFLHSEHFTFCNCSEELAHFCGALALWKIVCYQLISRDWGHVPHQCKQGGLSSLRI